ncbi:MAG: hypothetical protein FWG64_10375 [Firmicutes bacterium]|nr:hypothetical protein [Bacillota bacterium]
MKTLKITTILLLLTTFTSCMPVYETPSAGVWKNDYLQMTLYMNPAYQYPLAPHTFLGVYQFNNEYRKILLWFGNDSSIRVVDAETENTLWEWSFTLENDFINFDNIRIRDVDIDINSLLETQETLAFHKLETYEPINPIAWFPQFEHITGVWQSEDQNIILYFDPAYQSPISPHFLGIYRLNGEEIKIFAETRRNEGALSLRLHNVETFNTNRTNLNNFNWFLPSSWSPLLPNNFFDVENDRLYYYQTHLQAITQRRHLETTMVFHRLTEYEPINPNDWLALQHTSQNIHNQTEVTP